MLEAKIEKEEQNFILSCQRYQSNERKINEQDAKPLHDIVLGSKSDSPKCYLENKRLYEFCLKSFTEIHQFAIQK